MQFSTLDIESWLLIRGKSETPLHFFKAKNDPANIFQLTTLLMTKKGEICKFCNNLRIEICLCTFLTHLNSDDILIKNTCQINKKTNIYFKVCITVSYFFLNQIWIWAGNVILIKWVNSWLNSWKSNFGGKIPITFLLNQSM